MPDAFAFKRFNVPVRLLAAEGARHTAILLPAIGVLIEKYQKLAKALLDNSINVIMANWPGQGDSTPVPDWHHDYGYADLINDYLPSLIRIAKAEFPETDPVLIGHSLGGHMATLYAHCHRNTCIPIIGIACGNIYYRYWTGLSRLKTPWAATIFTLLVNIMGYLPGKKLRFGNREARTLIKDWSRVAWTGNFTHVGAERQSTFQHPKTLFIGLENDPFAPYASIEGLARLVSPQPHIHMMRSESYGNPHSSWLRAPSTVAGVMAQWIR